MSSLIQLRSVLEAIDSPRIVINPDLSVSFVNQAFTHAFGNSSLIGKHCYQLIFNQSAPCELCGAPCPIKATLNAKVPTKHHNTVTNPEDGNTWDIEISPIFNSQHQPEYFLGGLTRRTGRYTRLELGEICAKSLSMQNLLRRLSKLCATELPIVFIGPEGCGKRALGKLVHENSRRRQFDYICLNCEALTEDNFTEFLYSHFNHKWDMVCGTLYLSNIDMLTQELQATILKLIETGGFTHKKGGVTESVRVDLGIIGGSRCSIEELETYDSLRLDFFLRMSVCPLFVPGLDTRSEDIPDLIRLFLQEAKSNGLTWNITERAIAYLQNQKTWKGHALELKTILMRAAVNCDKMVIDLNDIQSHNEPLARPETIQTEEQHQDYIDNLILSWKGTKKELATRLGISERTLYRRIDKLTKTPNLSQSSN